GGVMAVQVKGAGPGGGPAVPVLEQESAGCGRGGRAWVAERTPGQESRAGALGPDRREMALARARRTDEGEEAVGPIRPALEHRKRRRIRRPGQKILASKAFTVSKRKCELSGSGGAQHRTSAQLLVRR